MKVIYWLAIFIVLLIIEIATMGLTTIWFAGGALVAAIACYAGANLTVQILCFLCGACRLWTGRSGWDIYRSFAPASASDETTCGEVL